MVDNIQQTKPVTDTPSNLAEFVTDPSFISFLGVIFLFLGLILIKFIPEMASLYAYYVGGITALIGSHAANDYWKTKALNQ